MVNGRTSTQTARSSAIVQDYLDVLLRNVLPEAVTDPEPNPAPAQVWSVEPAVELSAPQVPVPMPPAVVAPEPTAAAKVSVVKETTTAAAEAAAEAQEQAPLPGADKAFASLLFDVMGLKLAAPLHELGGIMPLADKLQPMVAQSDWFMGLIRWNGRTIRVVDTARLVMPERVEPAQDIEYQSIVVLGDSHWALAVNNADQSVHLQPADIRWRRNSGKRPWLAGTVLERLCALLDVNVLIAMLDDSDTARQVRADLDRGN